MPTTCIRLLPGLLLLVWGAAIPASDAAAQRWASVDVGSEHACALDVDGRAYCWGTNHQGQLGAATPDRCQPLSSGGEPLCLPDSSRTPVAVTGGHRFRMIQAGYGGTCGIDLDQHLLCWGIPYGPTPVTPAHSAGRRYRSIEDVSGVGCGAEEPSGGRCWKLLQREWTVVAEFPELSFRSVTPAPSSAVRFCALDDDGRLLCVGHNHLGELGVPSPVTAVEYVQPAGDRSYQQVAMMEHWTCGLTKEGNAFCWGNLRVPMGPADLNTETCSSGSRCAATPRPVAPGMVFTALAYRRDEVCGLTATGALHCWKADTAVRPRARATRFRQVSGGWMGWCGISQAGDLYCWEGDEGENDPVRVPLK